MAVTRSRSSHTAPLYRRQAFLKVLGVQGETHLKGGEIVEVFQRHFNPQAALPNQPAQFLQCPCLKGRKLCLVRPALTVTRLGWPSVSATMVEVPISKATVDGDVLGLLLSAKVEAGHLCLRVSARLSESAAPKFTPSS